MKLCSVRLLCLAGLILGTIGVPAQGQLAITEFLASNTKTLADQNGDFSDWIEIFNGSTSAVSLAGWHLTDDPDELSKWTFPNTNLAANGYLIVFASGKNRAVAGAQLHTSFSLSAGGEYLALVRPDGTNVVSEFAPEYPEQTADISYGTFQGTNYYFAKPTPGATNAAGFIALVADTKFSVDRGFYEVPFTLAITTETTNAAIRYTTNGTPPSVTNGIVYAAPLLINRTTVLRAAAFRTGFLPSNVDTHTYLFLDDVIRQSPTGQAPPGWPTSWGGNTVDYGMDPDVVNNAKYSGTIKNDLKAIPSFAIVMNLNDLFNSSTGIYANAGQEGAAWERPCSVELINPDGSDGFQIDAGIRIRGGFSRSTGNPKHAFRLFFRSEYGTPKLRFPLFDDAGTDTFDAIDLRTFQNYSWSFQGDANGVFLRDQFSRDVQLAMGHQSERGNFYHLYINGQYWGLYNTCERPEASYGETYYGGNKDDYDVIKVEAGPYTINATDGNMNAWTRLYNLAKAGLAADAAYQRVLGNNPDGTRNPAYENLVDVPNLIDYMLLTFYGGNLDAPISNFLSNTSPNNWYGIRNRNGPDGFRFFVHDAEHTLLPWDLNRDRTGPFSAGDTSVTKSNPQWIFQKMQANAEFRMLVADHVHRHFFNGGLLTPQACAAQFLARKAEIDRAVVGESARWGDAKRGTPMTRDVEWVTAVNAVLNNYFPQRSAIVLNQLKAKNLYPGVVAPSFNQHGGNINRGFSLSMSAPAGIIYYTLDGSDPRRMGGTVAPGAVRYQVPVVLNESVQAKSRVLNGTNWSALNEASFVVIQTFTELLITEIMYHPPADGALDGDEFEFLELKNVAPAELDLSGVRFTNGINYTFPNGTKLAPGRLVVLVHSPAAFTNKYPGVPVDGVYTGRLSNGGERLTLIHAVGTPIVSLTYGDQNPWPLSPDGDGFSLVPVNPNLNPNPNDPVNWRASSRVGGSPGADDPPANLPVVWINEVLTHTDPPQLDSIELHNPNSEAADVSHWYLTDQRSVPKKFRIREGTVIPAGGYVVFTEADFNPTPGMDPSFNLSSHGEEVYLYSGDAAGNLTGYSDGFSFGAAANGVAFGRHVISTGETQYPAQVANSLGLTNAGPRVGPVVINEIHYHPKPGEEEFIELKNITGSPVRLNDPAFPTNRWKISGIGFDFPADFEIPANGLLVVSGTDPAGFRLRNNVPPGVPVLGPFPGVLQGGGERLQLQRPDAPDVDTNGAVFVPYIVVDEVRYNNKAPWPTNADGGGSSLERLKADAYGNDPVNWRASFGAPSAGFENNGNRFPRVNAGADQTFQSATYPFAANLAGMASDDGLPNPPGALQITWSQVGGQGLVVFATPNQLSTGVSFPGVGTYVLRLTANDGELEAMDEMTVVIERTPSAVTFVTKGSVWKYLDDGSNQNTNWVSLTYDDRAWKSGPAELGYGDASDGRPEATVVSFGPQSGNKYATTYFRRSFVVQGASSVKELTVKLLRDDGGVVYLNGTEVFRSNMPEGDITFQILASGVVGGADETTFFEKAADPAVLREGTNVMAVEIHQVSRSSSTDISFDLELSGLALPANQAPLANAGNDLSVTWPTAATLNGTASDDGLPIPPGKFAVAWSKVSGPGSVTFANTNSAQTTATFSAPGIYVLQLAADDGELSAHDEITVTVSGESIVAWQARYFTPAELADPALSGDNADPDGDGLTNFQEYTAGTNPRDVQSVLKIETTESIIGSDGTIKIRFLAAAGKTYTLQYSDSVNGGVWQKLQDIAAEAVSHQVEVSGAISGQPNNRYYRIVTPQQP